MPREAPPLNWRLMVLLLLLAGGLAWLYRSSELEKRPMHTDEAILGIKTLELLKTGRFQYDPRDYHGPLLHQSTRALASLLRWTPGSIGEEQLRFVTVLYGLGLLLIPLLLGDVLTRTGTAFAALFIATSPMMCFYSRYYIMETPLVFFCGLFMAALWRWSQSKKFFWLILGGISLGCMHAAKETFVLNIAAMTGAYGVAKFVSGSFTSVQDGYSFSRRSTAGGSRLAWFLVPVTAALVSIAFYSNGFHDWSQVLDSMLTYKSYLQRSGGAGHEKPWHYYLALLFWHKNALCTWTEALIGGLALVGWIVAITDLGRPSHHRTFLVFLGTYAFGLLAIYSVIPYKTPWSVLAVDHALALLAGAGAAAIFRAINFKILKTAFGCLLLWGVYNLCRQTSLATDYNKEPVAKYSVHDLNPYVYSHTTTRVPEVSRMIRQLASHHPENKSMPVQIIESQSGWPFPWYLRDLNRVGYHQSLPASIPPAAVIITDISHQDEILARLAPKAAAIMEPEPDFVGPVQPPPPVLIYAVDRTFSIRPGVILTLIIEKNLDANYRAGAETAR